MEKICVLGLGYMGLPTSLLLSSKYQVTGVDIKKSLVEEINQRKLNFDEPYLMELFDKNSKNFIASTILKTSDVYIIAVPTPLDKGMNIADLSAIRLACEMISKYLKNGDLVIIESTIPPGTSEQLILPILKSKKEISDLKLAHCPERAIPGNTIEEMIKNDRIIGGINDESSQQAKEIYSSFVDGNIHITNIRTAEFVKLIENTYRDVNIALANELALICEDSGINVWEAIRIANKHPRVSIHKPGPGVGGHCIAIDPWFLTENTKNTRLITTARIINESMPNHTLKLIRQIFKDENKTLPPNITLLGVAYKGNVDDARETPTEKIIKLCLNSGFNIRIHDPFVKEFHYEILPFEESLKNSDCVVFLTDHDLFRKINPQKISSLMRQKKVIDTRNLIDKRQWEDAGFKVKILGSNDNERKKL